MLNPKELQGRGEEYDMAKEGGKVSTKKKQEARSQLQHQKALEEHEHNLKENNVGFII